MGTQPGSFDSVDDLVDITPVSQTDAAPLYPTGQDAQSQAPTGQGAASAPAAEPFVSQTIPPAITWGVTGAPSLAEPAMYINVNDSVRLTAYNSNANLTSVTAQLRLLLPDGTIQVSQLTIPNLTSDRTANSFELSQTEGFVLGIVLGPPGVPVSRGQCFVRADLVRGAAPTELTVTQLVADYLTTGFFPSWPFGEVKPPTDGSGYIYTFAPGAIGVGTPPFVNVPTGVRWRLMCIGIQLTTDAVAGTRLPELFVEGFSEIIAQINAPFGQGANATDRYTWGPSLPYSPAATTAQTAPLPNDLYVQGGTHITIITPNLDAGDGYAAWGIQVEEWLDV